MPDMKPLIKQMQTKASNAQFSATKRMAADLTSVVNRDKGTLARSQKVSFGSRSGDIFTSTIAYNPPDKRDIWTDRGVRPHTIRYGRLVSLKFRWGWRRVSEVHHPGNPAYKWFSKTVTLPNWSRMLRDAYR